MSEQQHVDVEVVEVCPRDGLQNEERPLRTADKVVLVRGLMAAGARRIEVTSFVHPKRVPQMADAEEVLETLGEHDGVAFIGLVLNHRGVQRAVATGALEELNYVVPVTDSFGRANQGVTTEEALEALPAIREEAGAARLRFTVSLAVAFGCPYEEEVSLSRLTDVAGRVAATAPDELALADTIGCAVPADVSERLRAIGDVSAAALRVHFHETRHTALANVQAALRQGVRTLDSSAAGIGGCPFAPGAAGNVATEDMVWMLHRSGYRTGIDVQRVVQTGLQVCSSLGVPPRSGIANAGVFPPMTPTAL